MSNKTHTNPLPAVSLPLPAFAVQVKPVVARIKAVLKGRAKTCALPLSDSTVSPLELAPADKQGNRAHRTFTRAQVVAIAREVVAIMSEKPSPAAVRDKVPSYWLGPKARESDLVKALSLTYTPKKGNSANQRRNAAAHCVGAFRREVKRLAKANTLASTLKSGDGWFAVGVLDNKGQPRPYPSEKKARKAYCRLKYTVYAADGKTVLETWYDTDKANRLATAEVYQQADSVGKADQGRVTRFAAATLDDLSPAAVRALAKKAGAPKRITSGTGATARSRQWFSDDITRLEGVMTPQ